MLVTGGAGMIGSTLVDQLVERGAAEIVVLDNFVRGRRENLELGGGERPRDRGRGRRPRPRPGRRADCDGIDVVFHQAAIRITQCAEEPRLALEVLVDGTFNVVEAAAAAGVRQARRRLLGLGLRAGGRVPDRRAAPPLRQRHPLRRGQGLQRGPAAQLPRDDRARLRRPALLQRLRPADGRPRRLHRGAGPLDGADRRRQSRR